MGEHKSRIDWADFVESAPYLTSAGHRDDKDFPDYIPAMAALHLLDYLHAHADAEGLVYMARDGLMDRLDIEPVLCLMESMEVFGEVAPILRRIVDEWSRLLEEKQPGWREAGEIEVDALYEAADAFDEWQAFASDNLCREFMLAADRARLKLCAMIADDPQGYFDIDTPSGLTGKGVEIIEMNGRQGRWRLRFMDGFPVGPNLCERDDGDCLLQRFSADRRMMDYEREVSEDEIRRVMQWIDLRSGLGAERHQRADGSLEMVRGRRWINISHGLLERMDETGRKRYTRAFDEGARVYDKDANNPVKSSAKDKA